MKNIWAPWRIDYITAPKNDGCFLCQYFSEDRDRENLILARGPLCAIVMNRYPYNAGHLLVLPYREVPDLAELTQEERHELMDLIVKAQEILTRALRPDGFNTGFNFGEAGGAGIPCHLHCHVVPRWNGDTNFMPVIGNTRVIPDSMNAMWERLHECVKA